MIFGKLTFEAALDSPDLVSKSVRDILAKPGLEPGANVAVIDPSLADTAAFCEHYEIGMEAGANCVIVEAKRAERVWYAACVILATTRVDVNGAVRKYLDARKISFAPMETAVTLTQMEYGGITPIGLPEGWPILIDVQVTQQPQVIIGSGIRGSKLLVEPALLSNLLGALVMSITK